MTSAMLRRSISYLSCDRSDRRGIMTSYSMTVSLPIFRSWDAPCNSIVFIPVQPRMLSNQVVFGLPLPSLPSAAPCRTRCANDSFALIMRQYIFILRLLITVSRRSKVSDYYHNYYYFLCRLYYCTNICVVHVWCGYRWQSLRRMRIHGQCLWRRWAWRSWCRNYRRLRKNVCPSFRLFVL